MARSVLFAHTIEAEDGRITVSISGPMAADMLERMARCRRRSPGGGSFPLSPLPWLGSAAVSLVPLLRGEEDEPDAEGEETPQDLKAIFGQGFDSGYEEFSERLVAYRALLGAVEPEGGNGKASRRKSGTAAADSAQK